MAPKLPNLEEALRTSVGETVEGGSITLTGLVGQLRVEPDPAKLRDIPLFNIRFSEHESGLSPGEATKALFGALAALAPEEQHRRLATLCNSIIASVATSVRPSTDRDDDRDDERDDERGGSTGYDEAFKLLSAIYQALTFEDANALRRS
ncbi:hypothetical protein SAMN05216215_1001111 [Saccharopolyspora shandongensis]|uniref:Uncharacterized protein n=1 Tax=Saccharopolyspora shandongensis TaxID=418495 RepID=A0A1H2QI38_9PSEU|nr:hypothetical protein [Saccharopolyspora shandongensis]SDW06812.1 hypothetical protein SAMN05216215_1001111 [Saccharopolyspora shandongensis]